MNVISRLSTRYPKTVIFIVLVLTVFFSQQFMTKSFVESDVTKFLPTDMESVKANDYFRKNFSYNESLIIGMEAQEQGILDPQVLRINQEIVQRIKKLRTHKTIDSKLTGKKETIDLPMGIDVENINSISGLEDAIMDRETGAVVTGSVIKKLKKEAGIAFTEKNENLLPESDEDLEKIIPQLKNHILNDRLFKGNILSQDGKATAIHVPMINKWDYKQRFAQLELETALDPEALKARFQGKTSLFPYEVYGKTIDGIVYNDAYIARHSAKVKEDLKDHLQDYLEPAYTDYPVLKELMSRDLTAETFKEIINVTQDRNFFMNPDMLTWDIFTSKLYDFMLSVIDPLSYENLEFQLPDVKGVYSLLDVYDKTQDILKDYQNKGINTYVAGQPVMVAVMLRVIDRDMGMLLPIGLVVILLMLAISFKSVRGVIIPLITVVLSVIWSYGMMALTGTPITSATSIVPIILLAVGSAYGIHFLNRYFEDARYDSDRGKILRKSINGVGVAILMAGLTTFAGFISLTSSSILMTRHFAIFTAFGIVVALVLTLTLSPAILCFWRLPRKNRVNTGEFREPSKFELVLINWASWVKNSPKKTVFIFTMIALVSLYLMKDLKFEGGMIGDFKKDNPVRMSDNFINRYLTGTGEIALLFKFRDNVDLENPWVQDQLKSRISRFDSSWNQLLENNPALKQSALNEFEQKLVNLSQSPGSNQKELLDSISLLNDVLNEEYVVEEQKTENAVPETSESDLNALLGEEPAVETSGGLDDLAGLAEFEEAAPEKTSGPFVNYSQGQVNGLKQLNQRLGLSEQSWEATGKNIVSLRVAKSSIQGKVMVQRWNLFQDLFATDIKQPYVLHKLESLRDKLVALEDPKVELDGHMVNPTGFVLGPVDLIRKTYSVFYHDEDPAFKKIPDVEKDNLGDPTLTDRGVIGVVLNQAQNSSRDNFEAMISPDLKEFQYSVMLRNSLTSYAAIFIDNVKEILASEFPENDPYIESISVGGQVPVMMEISSMIAKSQVTSVAQAMVFVFIVTFFIFRSAVGGLYSLIPLAFTILTNFGMMILLGWKINTGTVMVASISIGIGVDYTIHFLERFKAQLKAGDEFNHAYFNTIGSVGKAIIINAVSVAAGFMVLLFSDMGSTRALGLLMVGTMAYSSMAALTLLPAIIFVSKPKFLGKYSEANKKTLTEAAAKN